MKSSTLRLPALCLGLLTLAACSKGKPQGMPQMPPPQVGVITAEPQNAPLTKDLVGRLSAYRSADVRARVAGVLLKRVYKEGSEVKKGQVLFEIDPAPLKATLNAALGSLAEARATYLNDKIAADRARALAPKGYIAKSSLDDAEAAERTAAAAVKAAEANVQTARINLGYADVTSPIAGRAEQQQVTEGALVGSSSVTLLTTVDQIDPLYVNFTLSVTSLEQMQRAEGNGDLTLSKPDAAQVDITLPDGSPYSEAGTLDFSSTSVDSSTGAVTMRAIVPNPKHLLLPGMYVTLKAKLGEQHKVYLIPQPAIQHDTVGAYVMVVGKNGKVIRRDITLGTMSGGDWIVTTGIQPGDKVIVSGVQNVKEGIEAKASPWHPQASHASAKAPAGHASGK